MYEIFKIYGTWYFTSLVHKIAQTFAVYSLEYLVSSIT